MSTFSPVQECERPQIISAGISQSTPKANPEIISLVWKDIKEDEDDKDHKKINILGYNEKCYLELTTIGFDVGDEITLEIKENKENTEILKTLTVTIKEDNSAESEKEEETAIAAEDDWLGKQLIVYAKADKADYFKGELLNLVCCQHALKLGDESDLIKELNIKLAGFGEQGNTVPSKKFDLLTENAVKQFQRDYMKVQQTGIVCKHFLEKLDEFCEEYYIKIDSDANFKVKCPCADSTTTSTKKNWAENKCEDGFGKGRTSLSSPVKSGPEHPGVHRSLFWAVSAMKFYLDKVETTDGLKFEKFSSVYRCIGDNIRQNRNSTNHMGNAVDIQFSGSSGTYLSRADKVRELFAIYCGAQIRWNPKYNDRFCMEPSLASYYDIKEVEKDDPNKPGEKITEEVRGSDEFTATTWVHIDCREFNPKYQEDEFYCKTEVTLKKTSFIEDNLIETSDSAKYKDIKDCTYTAEEKKTREREERIWLGMIKDAYLLNFSNGDTDTNKKWKVKLTTIPKKKDTNLTQPRIQEIVTILDENSTKSEYKIKPRGHKDKNEGWIDKKYIKEICKYEKD